MSPYSTLVLNADGSPLDIVPWQHAIQLVLAGKAYTVEAYPDKAIRSVTQEWEWPCIVARTTYVSNRKRVRYSRSGILSRDGYTCQYCGMKARFRAELTLDHVVPRAQSRAGYVTLPWSGRRVPVTSWSNIVACCAPCNAAKADRTPNQAGMAIRKYPAPPTDAQRVASGVRMGEMPEQWAAYLT